MAREVRAAVLVVFPKEKEDGRRRRQNQHCLSGNENFETFSRAYRRVKT